MNPILMLIFILLVQLWIPIINPLLGAHLYTNPEWKFQLLYKAPGKYMTNRIYICEWPGPNQFLLDPRVDFSLKDNLIDSSKGCWSCIFQEPTYFSIGDNHIPGDWVKTGVINSWGQGDSGKCREVGLWYCHHVFNKHVGAHALPHYKFGSLDSNRHLDLKNMTAHSTTGPHVYISCHRLCPKS